MYNIYTEENECIISSSEMCTKRILTELYIYIYLLLSRPVVYCMSCLSVHLRCNEYIGSGYLSDRDSLIAKDLYLVDIMVLDSVAHRD